MCRWGGIETFAAYYGVSGNSFYTDRTTINAFKAVVSYVVQRTNTVNGIQYKNDPIIMSWETGNELCLLDYSIVPGAWYIYNEIFTLQVFNVIFCLIL
jgi:endo-1,4-beta-mannosidase